MAIATFAIGALSPLMSYGIGTAFATTDISQVALHLGCAMGTVLAGYGILELATVPKKERIKKLDVNIKAVDLVTRSLEDVIKLEKEKSKKITGPYKVIDNLDEDTYDNFVQYFENNKNNLFKEYEKKQIITDSSDDQLYNKVLTRMIINSKGLTK